MRMCKESVICEKAMKHTRAVESDRVKSARKAKDRLQKACESVRNIMNKLWIDHNHFLYCTSYKEYVPIKINGEYQYLSSTYLYK